MTHGERLKGDLERWGENKRDTDVIAHALAAEGPTEEWFAALDRRIDEAEAQDGVGIELERWAEFWRRETDAVMRRLQAGEGPTEEWFAALDRRIDEAGDDEGSGSPFSDDARPAVAGLQNSVRLLVRPDRPWPPRTPRTAMAEIPKAVDRAVVKARPRGRRRRALARFFGRRSWLLVCGAVALAGCASVAIATGHYLAALVLVVVGAGLDVLEGALGRISGTESPQGRWFAAMGSHLGDIVVIVGIAIAELHAGHLGVATVVFIAGCWGLFGSLGRTLAREVGRVFWRSSFAERAVRLAATTGYLAVMSVDAAGDTAHRLAPWFVAALFGGFGVWEVLRVGIELRRDSGDYPALVHGPDDTSAYLPLAVVGAPSPSMHAGDDGWDDGPAMPVRR